MPLQKAYQRIPPLIHLVFIIRIVKAMTVAMAFIISVILQIDFNRFRRIHIMDELCD